MSHTRTMVNKKEEDITEVCGSCDCFSSPDEPEEVKEYKKSIGNKSHMLARDKIFDVIAERAVWDAMIECERKGVKRCSLCSCGIGMSGICTDDGCIENGYTALESINSAKDKIKVALSGRT